MKNIFMILKLKPINAIKLNSLKSICLLVFFLLVKNNFAINSKVNFDNISIAHGLSQSTVTCIIQDKFGYMWFGTQDGLNLYDGYTFKVFKSGIADNNSLVNSTINCLYEDKHSNIWIGTNNGLSIYIRKTHQFISFQYSSSGSFTLSSNVIRNIYADAKGVVWISTPRGLNRIVYTFQNAIYKIKAIRFQPILRNLNSISTNTILSTIEDDKSNFWIATQSSTINRFNREKNEFIKYPIKNNTSYTCNSFLVDLNKKLWACTSLGLAHFDKSTKQFELFNFPQVPATTNLLNTTILNIANFKENQYWICTESQGLFYYNSKLNVLIQYKEQLNKSAGISSNTIYSIQADQSKIIWLGTNNGVSKFDPNKQIFEYYASLSELSNAKISENVWALYRYANSILMGSDNGLYEYNVVQKKHQYIPISFASGNNTVYSIEPFTSNLLLIAGSFGVCTYDIFSKKINIINLKVNNGLINNLFAYHAIAINASKILIAAREGAYFIDLQNSSNSKLLSDIISTDSYFNRFVKNDFDKTYWLCTEKSGVYKLTLSEESFKLSSLSYIINYTDVFKQMPIMHVYQRNSRELYLATYGEGIFKYDLQSKQLETYNESKGLCNNVVYSILPDTKNKLWLTTNNGLSCFDLTTLSFINYYESDGLLSNEFNLGAAHLASNGLMYVGGINGFFSFNPLSIKQNSYKPFLAITKLLLNNKEVEVTKRGVLTQDLSLTKSIDVRYNENSITLEFAALHYVNSSKNEYAYMLEGVDDNWNYSGTRKIAVYNKLAPGNYLFKLKAQNADGVWNNDVLTLRIIVKPPYYKTWWFNLILFFGITTLVLYYYKTKANKQLQVQQRLESEVKLRTHEVVEKNKLLEEEKQKSEKLLLNILPEETVGELKLKGKVSARQYRQVTVMFTDFVGFTKIAEKYRPQELITVLDMYFVKFDEIIEKYQIEKIKTIGDSYMCASGLPIRNKTNAIDMTLASLEIQAYAEQIQDHFISLGNPPWTLRIGIHTGELIAGVIGLKRFAYDIWGDTVNTANRIEEASNPGKVNISQATYELIKDFFNCTYRGKIAPKNKGEIAMYFVDSIKAELSENGEGKVANQAFFDRVEHLLYSKINYTKAEKFIVKLLEEELPTNLYYHALNHTLDVCNAAEQIGKAEGITSEDLHIIKTAALFHDAGFTTQYEKNEAIGCKMAEKYLPDFGYSSKQIAMVCQLIMATQIPTNPQNIFEQIICDADLDYLGRDDFETIANSLYRELYERNKVSTKNDWDKLQIAFLSNHRYYTPYSKQAREKNKQKHLQKLVEKIN